MDTLRNFVEITKLHPILVNFTAALVPVSVFNDFLARLFKSTALRATAWWTLFYAVIITPFTAAAGWLFWMKDDNGVEGMTIHKWLGTGFAVALFGLFYWRRKIAIRQEFANALYLILGIALVAVLIYQGQLGGTQVFSGM